MCLRVVSALFPLCVCYRCIRNSSVPSFSLLFCPPPTLLQSLVSSSISIIFSFRSSCVSACVMMVASSSSSSSCRGERKRVLGGFCRRVAAVGVDGEEEQVREEQRTSLIRGDTRPTARDFYERWIESRWREKKQAGRGFVTKARLSKRVKRLFQDESTLPSSSGNISAHQ